MIMKNIEDVRRVVDAEKPLAVRRLFAESCLQDEALRKEYAACLEESGAEAATEWGYQDWLATRGVPGENWQLPEVAGAEIDALLARLEGSAPRVIDGAKISIGTIERLHAATTVPELRDVLIEVLLGADVG